MRPTGQARPTSKTLVEATTIDDEWNRLGRPPVSVIKIDVEGGEYDVLLGARECIAAQRPSILTEWAAVHASHYGRPVEQFFDLVREYRYQMYSVPQMSRAESRSMLRAQLLFCSNFLLVPEE